MRGRDMRRRQERIVRARARRPQPRVVIVRELEDGALVDLDTGEPTDVEGADLVIVYTEEPRHREWRAPSVVYKKLTEAPTD